ncbi:unnamed protein product [Echinostoma caproni]|uniref:DNA replication licensing factor MCM3 n=1 Tax=Echinostoma caproni TaxID=27848 RepID=A0A183A7N6_9TREM|nr:unnamed protein product [Echinostoma caproni]
MDFTVDQSLLESEREYLEFLDETLNACQKALKKCVQNVNPDYAKQKYDFFVGFEGSFGSRHVTPRTLNASLLGHMVCLEGIVTKASLIRPKVVCSVHYCPATKKSIERRYADLTSLEAFPSSGVYPTKDDEGNLLETEYGLSVYQDHQSLTVQEMPETAPAGQLPRSVDVLLDNDLVDAVQPGDRVQVVGQYRCLPGKRSGYTSASFRTVLIANNIQSLSKESGPSFSDKDISMMRLISKRNDVVSLLTRSIAPSIHGHEQIKRAILLLLLGGVERTLSNGSRIRGDVNLLLLGDPSVAKSQFLRFVLHVAHRAIATTGRGSSGVGLTAAVTTDMETGERNLEAGAMVLADRGIVCIDEFDKMSDIDRTAIHEVMEQGRVTIAKAGIQAKLNARCSVLAAANPVYGRYDQYKTPMENIGLQDSLLSRFDLLFIVLDKADPESDRAIAEHVLRTHRFRGPGEQEGEALPLQNATRLLSTGIDPLSGATEDNVDDNELGPDGSHRKDEDQVYVQQSDLLRPATRIRSNDQLTLRFLQKYLHVARQLKPQLTKEAASILAEKYCDLRAQEAAEGTGRPGPGDQSRMRRTQPITARTLETLIRLATAHAKARMSKTVTKKDAESAVQLVSFVLFKEVLEKRRKRDRASADGGESGSEDESPNDNLDTRRPAKRNCFHDDMILSSTPFSTAFCSLPARLSGRAVTGTTSGVVPASDDPYAFQDDAQTAGPSAGTSGVDTTSTTSGLSTDRLRQLSTAVSRVFQERRVEQLPVQELTSVILGQGAGFTKAEIRAGLEAMHADNRIMLTSDDVWLI